MIFEKDGIGGNSPRMAMGIIGLESTGNAGSDFFINRHADDGTLIERALTINRSNGNVGIGTTTPSQALEVKGNNITVSNEVTLAIESFSVSKGTSSGLEM